jgi:HprK-related kinase A
VTQNQQLSRKIASSGFRYRVGPFHIQLKSSIPSVAAHLCQHYSEYPKLDNSAFIDFYISVDSPVSLRRIIKPQVIFSLDDYQPFTPLPLAQAAAQFEWGLNWCIAGSAHQYLIIHSAVVEKNGVSIIMPGQPGSGKSTLCAALLFKGWRLLSDEMTLVSLTDLTIQPVPRPVSLKNQSIDIIRNFDSNAKFGPIIEGTSKGDVSHMEAPIPSIQQQDKTANCNIVVLPKYNATEKSYIRPKQKAEACMALIENAFNFNILQDQGFEAVTDIIDRTESYEIGYQNLAQAIDAIEQISGDRQ